MENRNASGYKPFGYVETKAEADALCSQTIEVSVSPYPLQYENNGRPVPLFKQQLINLIDIK
jgi:hypothetical protein